MRETFCFCSLWMTMESSFSAPDATFRDQKHLKMKTGDDPDSTEEEGEEESILETERDEEQDDLTTDKEGSSVMDQAGRMEHLSLNSDLEQPLEKPVCSYIDETLPDLLRSGSPLRRRLSSPVSNTLQQVRREVELSRRRSLRLKAQVNKLQEQSHDGLVWSQQKERVTEEIQSIVKLLTPLTDLESASVSISQGDALDTALLQLKNISRTLAFNHTSHRKDKEQNMEDDGVILRQALRDRDDALAKKKAMESELLKSKTDLMLLNNQLLEAVQQRLEMAIELEAWKDDVQTILHHQLMCQQQAEQKKSKGFTLRRSKEPSPAQSPSLSRASMPSTPSQSANTPVSQRWKERLRRGRANRQTNSPQSPSNTQSEPQSPGDFRENSFQNVSLD